MIKLLSIISIAAFALSLSPSEAFAQNQKKAVVVPAMGKVPSNILAKADGFAKEALKRRGFQVATKKAALEAVEQSAQGKPSIPERLQRIGDLLQADLVVSYRLRATPDGRVRVVVLGWKRDGGEVRGFSMDGGAYQSDTGRFQEKALAAGVLAGIAAFYSQELKVAGVPVVVTELNLTASAVPKKQVDQPAEEPKDAPEDNGEEEPEDEPSIWDKFDHAGLFVDMAFVFSHCKGDVLCTRGGNGYGGRLRIGYRILSRIALSVTAVGAVHDLPAAEEFQDITAAANIDTMFAWWGVYGGIRFHPVNNFFIDPYIGMDFGATWLFYNEPIDVEAATRTYLGYTLPDTAQYQRVNLTLKGFSLVPEFGVRIFILPTLALGVSMAWVVPFWKEVCREVAIRTLTDDPIGGQEGCFTLEEARDFAEQNLPVDESKENLHVRKSLPEYFLLELGLTFQF